MISKKPYLIRAFYDWIQDSQKTPYLLIDASHGDVEVPTSFVSENGEIVLDVSAQAVRDFVITREHVTFDASFPGFVSSIHVPISHVLAIYCHETEDGIYFDTAEEQGMQFSTVEEDDDTTPLQLGLAQESVGKKTDKPVLRIVEDDDSD